MTSGLFSNNAGQKKKLTVVYGAIFWTLCRVKTLYILKSNFVYFQI